MMSAIIITIGDELLIGQVVNTNAAFIAERLNEVGIPVTDMVTVADDEEHILRSLREQVDRHEVAVVTGGLGPTHDDITRGAVCAFLRVDLVRNPEAEQNVRTFMEKRGRPWSTAAENQALVPRGATIIPNRHGTAPGELFDLAGRSLIVLPGVPYEMEAMMRDFVVPYLRERNAGNVILHRTLRTTGIAESVLAKRLGPIDEILDGARLAFLPSPSGVRLRITMTGNDRSACERKLAGIEDRMRKKISKYIYGTGDEELEEVVGTLLAERGRTIAVAESCTGGHLANKITHVPGSSRYFERGVVTYSNRSKTELLGVPMELIERHGAVSREVAEAMARGMRTSASTDIALSTTGIAGPSGGTAEKPVGLVWIGYSDSREVLALKFQFGDERIRIKERASQAALELLRRKLLGME